MTRKLSPLAAIAFSLGLATAAYAQDGTLYENARVWTGEGFERMDFAVSGDRFVAVDEAASFDRVDLDGRWVMPPFGEGHTHKFETEWTVARFTAQMFEQGVFYAKSPGAYAPNIARIAPLMETVDTVDVSFAMGGLTTPYGHPEGVYVNVMTRFWYEGFEREDFLGQAFHSVSSSTDVDTALDRLVEQGADFVKIFLQNSDTWEERRALLDDPAYREARDYPDYNSIIGLNPALVPVIVAGAHARGLTVSAHVSNAADFSAAVWGGVDEINHMPGASWETGYTLENQLPSEEDARLAAERGIPVIATAAVRLAATPEEHRDLVRRTHLAVLERLQGAGVEILIGIDNFGLTTRSEIDYLRELGIMSDAQLLQAWIDTSRAVFPDRMIAEIEPGYEASFLVLDADPLVDFTTLDRIEMRIKQGQDLDAGAE